jgi:hypothetical protein
LEIPEFQQLPGELACRTPGGGGATGSRLAATPGIVQLCGVIEGAMPRFATHSDWRSSADAGSCATFVREKVPGFGRACCF